MKRTVLNLLAQAVSKYPNINYVNEKTSQGWIGKTYPQVANESDFLAVALIDKGLKKDDKVSVIAEGRSSWIISEYGILKAGGIIVPLSIKLLPEEVSFRVNHSESKFIITSHNVVEKVALAWNDFTNKDVILIYMDEDIEYARKVFADNKITHPVQIFTYKEMIELGNSKKAQYTSNLREIADAIEENDVVTISYTSGTTGNPKGIMLTQLNYYSNSIDAIQHFNIEENIKTLLILPLDHSFAHTVCIYTALTRGLQLYFVDARGGGMATLKNIPINLKEVNPDFLLTVPALSGNFMNKIKEGIAAKGGFVEKLFNAGIEAGIKLNKDGYRKATGLERMKLLPVYKLANALIFKKVRQIFGSNLRYCVGGGALLDVKQQHFYYALGIPIFQGYGLSEATPIISANTPVVHKMGTSGKVFATIDCRIKDDKGNDLPKGKKGEIVIFGNNVMKGYYKNEKATNETIKDGWLYTGDLGYYDEDGFLMVTGREKALLISQDGEKYSPESIEEAIMNSSDIINQAMVYNDHSRFTSALVTINITPIDRLIKAGSITTAEQILDIIAKEVSKFKNEPAYKGQFPDKWTPAAFAIIEDAFTEQNFMINSTLKMVRYKITETYKSRIDSIYQGDAAIKELNLATIRKMFSVK